jgi:outer membrane protein assembly factor BamB
LYALNAATGAELWKVNVGDAGDSVAVSGGLVYVGSMDSNMNGCLQALDGATGTERWKLALPPPGAPTVSGGLVYFGGSDAQNTGDYIYAMDAATRAQRWKTQTADWVSSAPIVSDGLVYVAEDEEWGHPHVYALDAATGTQRWKLRRDYRNSRRFTPLIGINVPSRSVEAHDRHQQTVNV